MRLVIDEKVVHLSPQKGEEAIKSLYSFLMPYYEQLPALYKTLAQAGIRKLMDDKIEFPRGADPVHIAVHEIPRLFVETFPDATLTLTTDKDKHYPSITDFSLQLQSESEIG